MASPQAVKPRVLIVDDSPANRMAFEAVLEKDFTVTLAESGDQALEFCRRQEFAVIVLDVRMPGMNGFDTAEALRKREATRATPIIIFTSAYEQTMQHVTRGFVAGATDFLFAPVEPDLLRLKVKTYAQIYLQHEALRQKVRQLDAALADLHAVLQQHGLATDVESRLQEVEQTAAELRQFAL